MPLIWSRSLNRTQKEQVVEELSHIFSNSGSITGSIGEISQYYNFSRLIKFLKFTIETIKSGQIKDIGDSSKALTIEVKRLLNS